MDPRLIGIATIFRLNDRLFHNCLDALDDNAACVRPNDQTNSIAFVALHLVESRHFAAKVLGIAFLAQHESYHAGQLALLRKYVGAPAMAYP